MAADPTELTEACRQFLDTWGYGASAQDGQAAGAFPTVAQQIIPVISLGGRSGTGTGALQPWIDLSPEFMFGSFMLISGVAAEFTQVLLLNPAGSGKDAYVTRIYIDGTGSWIVTTGVAALPTAQVEASKQAGAAGPVCSITSDTAVAQIGNPTIVFLDAGNPQNTGHYFQAPFKAEPGQGIMVEAFNANTAFTGNFEWSEVVR